MSLWSRWAILRSDGGISAIFARQSASASALLPLAFRSLINSFMAAFSSAVNTLEAARRVGFLVAAIGPSPFKVGVLDTHRAWRPLRRHALRGAVVNGLWHTGGRNAKSDSGDYAR